MGHTNIIQYCNRPFTNILEHDTALIKNINSLVQKNDTLWIIGDFTFNNHKKYREQINCSTVNLLLGNHDSRKSVITGGFTWIGDYKEVNDFNKCLILCHYPFRNWNKQRYGSINLHGHVHAQIKDPIKNSVDIGVDAWEYRPVRIYDILKRIGGESPGPTKEIKNGP